MITSLKIDGLTIQRLRTVNGFGSPTPRRDVTLKATRHGSIDRTFLYEGRVLEIEALVVGLTEGAAWADLDQIKGKLQLGTTHTLTVQRQGIVGEQQMRVIVADPVDAIVSYEDPRIIRWGVSLHAPDPRIFSSALNSGSYDPAASISGGGLDVTTGGGIDFPMVFSTTTATHLEVVNAGNTSTPPVLTIRGPVTNPIIDNDTTAQSIFLIYPLGSSETIVVDVDALTATLNGAERLDLVDAANTVWWNLVPGTNRLRLRGTGMVLTQTLLTCDFRDAQI